MRKIPWDKIKRLGPAEAGRRGGLVAAHNRRKFAQRKTTTSHEQLQLMWWNK